MAEKIIAGDRLAEMVRVKRPQVWCYRQPALYLRMLGGSSCSTRSRG